MEFIWVGVLDLKANGFIHCIMRNLSVVVIVCEREC